MYFSWVYNQSFIDLWNTYTYILLGCFIGVGAIEHCACTSGIILKDNDKLNLILTKKGLERNEGQCLHKPWGVHYISP